MKTHRNDSLYGALLTMLLGALLVLGFSLPARAALGGNLDSVEADRAHMQAEIKVTQSDAYAVHEIKAPTGTVVREYVSPDGHVFGVAWQGPFMPDMKQILGTYLHQYSAAAKAQKAGRPGHRPLNIQEPGLVVQNSGHMRFYSGRAYDPGLLPQGVGAEAIR
jgi:Protein of unknown function (DUF2844)